MRQQIHRTRLRASFLLPAVVVDDLAMESVARAHAEIPCLPPKSSATGLACAQEFPRTNLFVTLTVTDRSLSAGCGAQFLIDECLVGVPRRFRFWYGMFR